jgi:UDP:flavonoid glycosyltransferase YjiC (YdhE family)
MTQLFKLGPGFARLFFRLVARVMASWFTPLNDLRGRLGLPLVPNPLQQMMFSPWGTQAWFSRVLAQPQIDWPANTAITGFPFYDKLEPGSGMTPELQGFLDDGPPPVVFTLGSSAVFDAGKFYSESLSAVSKSGQRAVLLIGRDQRNLPPAKVPPFVFVAEYAPYSELLPRAAATVHQGGVGTTAQALRSGEPMIVVPWSHDQPDNAMRIQRLGAGRVIPRTQYSADRLERELKLLLSDNACAAAAQAAGQTICAENGVATACAGLEEILQSH